MRMFCYILGSALAVALVVFKRHNVCWTASWSSPSSTSGTSAQFHMACYKANGRARHGGLPCACRVPDMSFGQIVGKTRGPGSYTRTLVV